jgi:hypothetical protein
VPLAVALFLVYRLLGAMSADSLFSMNASCQFLLIILGVVVAVKPDIGVKHPWIVIGAFVLIGGAGMIAAMRQQQIAARETAEAQRQTAEANSRLATSIENLNKGATEIARVQALNTELQERLLQSSGDILSQGKTISGLSQKAADTARQAVNTAQQAVDTARRGIDITTGGEGFCYMFFSENPSGGAAKPVFGNPGKTPLYDVYAKILDLQHLDRLRAQNPQANPEAAFTSFAVGELAAGGTSLDLDRTLPFNTGLAERQDYQVGYDGRNGWWVQDIILKKVGNGWAMASRVFRTDGANYKLVFTKVDQNFPGEPDWRDLDSPTPSKPLIQRFRRKP